MRGRFIAAVAAAALSLGLAALPAQQADAAVDKIGFGFPESSVAAVQAEGAKLSYSTSWAVGGDTSYVDNALAAANSTSTTPVIHWYYWGDSISPACVDNWSDPYVCKDGRTRQKWNEGATRLADLIHQYRPDRQTIVTLELEFHKSNIDDHENLDAYLETQANLLNKYPNEVVVVLGWGEWATASTYNQFDRAQNASDWAGTQILFSCIRQPLNSTGGPGYYRNGVGRVIEQATALKNRFAKPVFIYDWAASSYSEGASGDEEYRSGDSNYQCVNDSPSGYEHEQNELVKQIFSRIGELKAAEVVGFVFRALDDDANRAIYKSDGTFKDYHKIAERWFGFRHTFDDGRVVKKLAWNTVMQGIKTENGSPAPPPNTSTSEWKGEAEAFTLKTTGGQCTTQTPSGGACWNLWSNGSISTTTSSLTSGTKTITVVALGDPAGGVWPTMEIRVDGTLVKTATVGDDIWQPFSASVSLAAGTHTVEVKYTNDGSVDGNDRNLLVDYAQFTTSGGATWSTQAEAFTTKTAGGLINSTGASGGQYWNLWSNGYIETTMSVPYTSTHQIEVMARGDVAGGIWPKMNVYVDGTLVLAQDVIATSWTSYRVSRSLSGGSHTIRIEFPNDGVIGTEDRNLKLDVASLYS